MIAVIVAVALASISLTLFIVWGYGRITGLTMALKLRTKDYGDLMDRALEAETNVAYHKQLIQVALQPKNVIATLTDEQAERFSRAVGMFLMANVVGKQMVN